MSLESDILEVDSFFRKHQIYLTYSNVYKSRPATEFAKYSQMLDKLKSTRNKGDIQNFYNLALLNYRITNYSNALELLEKILNTDSLYLEASILKRICAYQKETFEKWDWEHTSEDAINAFDTVIKIDPSNAFGYFLKGRCYEGLFNYPEVI